MSCHIFYTFKRFLSLTQCGKMHKTVIDYGFNKIWKLLSRYQNLCEFVNYAYLTVLSDLPHCGILEISIYKAFLSDIFVTIVAMTFLILQLL